MTDIITVNAGGRHFVTTVSTLQHSGAGYFQALLTRWTPNATEEDSTGPPENKRARLDEQHHRSGHRAETPPLFVDCDPDVFDEVLYFMRRGCIKAVTAVQPFRLQMILEEARFFAYDALVAQCEKTLKKMEEEAKKASASPRRRAYSKSVCIYDENSYDNDDADFCLKSDEVLYISSAILAGDCSVHRYATDDKDNRNDIQQCYLGTCNSGDSGDFKLHYNMVDEYNDNIDDRHVISHVGLDQIHCGRMPIQIDFRQNIDLCISPSEESQTIRLSIEGSASWYIHCWVGPPGEIPMLNRGGQQKTRPRKDAAIVSAMFAP